MVRFKLSYNIRLLCIICNVFHSDDRSPEAFKRKIEETTQMKSVLMTDNRPNCLIIDEIDGASQVIIGLCFI